MFNTTDAPLAIDIYKRKRVNLGDILAEPRNTDRDMGPPSNPFSFGPRAGTAVGVSSGRYGDSSLTVLAGRPYCQAAEIY